jgi:transcriptional regulator with XRE-family HTH domain
MTQLNGPGGHTPSRFGERLRLAREYKRMPASILAGRLGVTAQTVYGWQADRVHPSNHHMKELAGILDVSIDWLAHGTPEAQPKAPLKTFAALPNVAASAPSRPDPSEARATSATLLSVLDKLADTIHAISELQGRVLDQLRLRDDQVRASIVEDTARRVLEMLGEKPQEKDDV